MNPLKPYVSLLCRQEPNEAYHLSVKAAMCPGLVVANTSLKLGDMENRVNSRSFRLIRRREALVFNTPDDHVTWDIREGVAKLGDLRFNVLDSAGIETEVSSGTILGRTTAMTANVLARTQFAVFTIDVRAGLSPLDLEVGKWLRKHAPQIIPIVVMNKSESIGSLDEVASEAIALGFGEPIAISAETRLGIVRI